MLAIAMKIKTVLTVLSGLYYLFTIHTTNNDDGVSDGGGVWCLVIGD